MRSRVLLVLVLLLAACGESGRAGPAPRQAAPLPASTPGAPSDQEIAHVLDDWHAAAAKADEERYFAHFAPYGVFLGTDGKERWTVPEFRTYAHPFFARGRAWSFHSTRRVITFVKDVAWFDEDLDTPNLGPSRGTGVLVKDDRGTWKIAQYNLSVPIPNERFKEVKQLIGSPAPPSSSAPAQP